MSINKAKLYELAYQLLVTLSAFPAKIRHKKERELPPNENTNTRHFLFNGSSVALRSSLPKICCLENTQPVSA
jgi:hypothetical protein